MNRELTEPRYTKLKQKDAVRIIENNNVGVISTCESSQPYSVPVYYDTDSYCGCIKILIRAKECGVLVSCIKNNNKVSFNVIQNQGYCSNQTNSVVVLGTATITPDDTDCCNPCPSCYVTIEIEPTCISGRQVY